MFGWPHLNQNIKVETMGDNSNLEIFFSKYEIIVVEDGSICKLTDLFGAHQILQIIELMNFHMNFQN